MQKEGGQFVTYFGEWAVPVRHFPLRRSKKVPLDIVGRRFERDRGSNVHISSFPEIISRYYNQPRM
jgi:hypothetical protein